MNQEKLIKIVGAVEQLSPYFSTRTETKHLVTWIKDGFVNGHGGIITLKCGRVDIQMRGGAWREVFSPNYQDTIAHTLEVAEQLKAVKPHIDRLLEGLNSP